MNLNDAVFYEPTPSTTTLAPAATPSDTGDESTLSFGVGMLALAISLAAWGCIIPVVIFVWRALL